MAFFAVLREGLETAIFMLAAFQTSTRARGDGGGVRSSGSSWRSGSATAIYRGGIRINLARFFRITGTVLVLVAAGLLASAVHEFAEAGLFTAFQSPAVDLSWLVRPGTVAQSLVTGMLGLQPVPTVAELGAWLLYAIPVGLYVLWPSRQRPRPVPTVDRVVPDVETA